MHQYHLVIDQYIIDDYYIQPSHIIIEYIVEVNLIGFVNLLIETLLILGLFNNQICVSVGGITSFLNIIQAC